MNIFLKIYVIFMFVLGIITSLWLLLGLIYMIFTNIKVRKETKKQLTEFKEAIAKSGMGKDLNRPLTEDEKELLKKTGKLEFTETLDMKTLNVKKEVKN